MLKSIRPVDLPLQSKYIELVMKCIWKLTKIIPQLISTNSLDISQLMLDVHNFLLSSPPSEWKRRTLEKVIPQADMPLRTVKTIIHELVTILSDDVYQYLDLISDAKTSHAVAYLKQMLDSDKKKKLGTTNLSSNPTNPKIPSAGPGMMVTASFEDTSSIKTSPSKLPKPSSPLPFSENDKLSYEQIQSQLSGIFDKIRDKDQTKSGIYDLFEFQKRHPYANGLVEQVLSSTGAYFQGYVRRGLQGYHDNVDVSPPVSPKRSVSMIGKCFFLIFFRFYSLQ